MAKKLEPRRQLNIRITSEEAKALDMLTKREERTPSDLVRRLIRAAAAAVQS